MRFTRKTEPREEELALLADGSLAPERREALEARVAQSPELAARLAEQERALAIVRSAVAAVETPTGMRAQIEAERRARRAPRLRPRGLVLAGGFAAAAAAALLLVLTLPSGAGGPTLAEAAALATRPASAPAPSTNPGEPKLLDAAVDGVTFPSWATKFGWKATGTRSDLIDGRETTTVFYEKNGKRIGYTIVGGESLDVPEGAAPARREGVDLDTLSLGGRQVVTWLRAGKTCILSGDDVDRNTLVKLAAWKGQGAVSF
jgi:anti-sigma factor RsiW